MSKEGRINFGYMACTEQILSQILELSVNSNVYKALNMFALDTILRDQARYIKSTSVLKHDKLISQGLSLRIFVHFKCTHRS